MGLEDGGELRERGVEGVVSKIDWGEWREALGSDGDGEAEEGGVVGEGGKGLVEFVRDCINVNIRITNRTMSSP